MSCGLSCPHPNRFGNVSFINNGSRARALDFSKTCFHLHGVAGKARLQGVSEGVGPVWTLHLPFTRMDAWLKLAKNCLNLTLLGWCEGYVKPFWRVFGIPAPLKPLCTKGKREFV